MKLDRRRFLQSLLMLGVSPSVLGGLPSFQQLISYQSVLATTNSRKLALLVGINQYEQPKSKSDTKTETPFVNLQGCLTDVDRQRDLLIERYGFQAADIVTLTDAQATRGNIETVFVEHLIKQAEAGDVVVFHFSGYGSQVKLQPKLVQTTDSLFNQDALGFLPIDGLNLDNTRNDLLQETLFLLARSLATDKITLILDCSHQIPNQALQGNLRIRSCLTLAPSPSSEEISFQSQLSPRNKILGKGGKSDASGIILSAAHLQQGAGEFIGRGFSAGLLTYSLTQYLWQVTSARRVITVVNQTNAAIAPVMGKYQQAESSPVKTASSLLYGTLPTFSPAAEAVVEKILEPNFVTVKLTGLSPLVVNNGIVNSYFRLLSEANEEANEEILLQIIEQTGLKAKALVLNLAIPLLGTEHLQEAIRVIPRHLGLMIALDSQLDRIERVDAISAFSAIATVTGVINTGEQAADCVLGKKEDHYGLFTEGRRLLLRVGEDSTAAIKSAISKLAPKLDQILAQKYWNLTENEQSSSLGLKVTLAVLQDSNAIAILQRETSRYAESENLSLTPTTQLKVSETGDLVNISKGSLLQYRIENYRDQPLYFLILGIDANGKAIAWYPGEQAESIEPKQTQIIPDPKTAISWRVAGNSGLAQISVIAALTPFQQTWQALAENLPSLTLPDETHHPAQILEIKNPLAIAQSLLEDLHRNSAVSSNIINNSTDYYALDMKTWATLNFIYQII